MTKSKKKAGRFEMRYFLDALICGPAATADYFVNEFCERVLAPILCLTSDIETKSKEKAAEKETAKETTTEKTEKAEIIEFAEAKEKVNSTINAQFSTVDDEDILDKKFTEDQVSNYVDDIVDKVVTVSGLNLDSEKDLNDIKLTTLALLLAINKAKFTAKLSTEYLKTMDEQIELNTIYKFFTNTKFFNSVSCIQLNEVITTQLLYDTVTSIYETQDFSQDEVMTQILAKTKKRLEKEAISTAALNDEVDPVTPVVFNQGVLSSAFSGKHPKVAKTTEEYIINFIKGILPEDWVRDNSVTLEMSPKQDMFDPNKDTGMALLTVKIFGEVMKTFDVDLDTITGNGYGLGIPAYFPGPQNQPIVQTLFVSIEKFPNIIKNAIIRNFYTLNNPADPDSIEEFVKVIKDTYGPEIYNRFDLTGMSKHLAFMTNEEKEKFGQNLLWIASANWPNLGLSSSYYRMRVRNYKSPDKFTLVSDKNTRQQMPDMLPVFGDQYKRYFKDPEEDVIDQNILVCKFDTDHIDIAINGAAVNGVVLPKKVEQNIEGSK